MLVLKQRIARETNGIGHLIRRFLHVAQSRWRFASGGAGNDYGPGGKRTAGSGSGARGPNRIEYIDDSKLPKITNMAQADAWRASELAKRGHDLEYREAIEARYEFYKRQFAQIEEQRGAQLEIGRPAQGPTAEHTRTDIGLSSGPGGAGRGFGGGGATGSWNGPVPSLRQSLPSGASVHPSISAQRLPASLGQSDPRPLTPQASEDWRTVERNGYLYEIDTSNRTRRVSGAINLNPEQGRSLATQLAAGGEDRRPDDHGGHYIARRFNGPNIARRFNGPTDAFNHFAQDAKFNRGRYAMLANQWAQAKRAGKRASVKIVPVFEQGSLRPSLLNIWFWIDSERHSLKLPNEPKEKRDAKD